MNDLDLDAFGSPPRTFTARNPRGFAHDNDRHEIVMHRGNLDTVWAMTDAELAQLAEVVNARLMGIQP